MNTGRNPIAASQYPDNSDAILPVTPGLAASAGADAWSNADPADRLIVWTAKLYEVELIHTDDQIALRTDLKLSFYPR